MPTEENTLSTLVCSLLHASTVKCPSVLRNLSLVSVLFKIDMWSFGFNFVSCLSNFLDYGLAGHLPGPPRLGALLCQSTSNNPRKVPPGDKDL